MENEDALWSLLALVGLVIFITWIFQLVRLSKRKSKVAFWLILIFGLLPPITPIVTFISLFLGRGKEEEEKKEEYFWCGICQIKCSNEIFGAETVKEGKICRFCLIEKRRKQDREEK